LAFFTLPDQFSKVRKISKKFNIAFDKSLAMTTFEIEKKLKNYSKASIAIA
jgi:hypothetical protein